MSVRHEGDYLASLGYKIPKWLDDDQLAILADNGEWRSKSPDGKCPVCRGAGSYRHLGEERECPDDSYGHPMLRLAKWYWVCNVPWEYQLLNYADWPVHTARKSAAKSAIDDYLENFEALSYLGKGITFWSPGLGTGKTWAATAILKALARRGVQGWFAPFMEVKSYFEISDSKKRDALQDLVRYAPVLVLDEVKPPWSAASKEFFADKLENLIRPRTNAHLPTILTTNLTEDELEQYYDRTFSLLSAKNEMVSLEGEEDFRANQAHWLEEEEAAMNGERRPVW